MARSGAPATIPGGGTAARLGRTGGAWAQVGLSVA
jgi:hypothetical protein